MMNRIVKLVFLMLTLLVGDAWAVATCTSKATGNWGNANTWSCVGTPAVTVPGSSNPVVLASPFTVTLCSNSNNNNCNNNNNNTFAAASLTIDSGATLNDDNQDLTVTGNVVNNGTFGTNGGALIMTGANTTLSGSGTFDNTDVQIDASGISLPSGSTMNFTNQAQVRVGRNNTGTFTINGAITGTGLASGDRILRVYKNSSVTINGSITAPNAYIRVEKNALVTNNGAVSVQYLDSDGNNTTSVWTQGANSALTVSQTPANKWRGTLNASASGNTVTYNSPASPLTPSASTYYNLAGTGVVCPVAFTILGTSPCAASLFVQGSPSNCTNVTGVGTVAWASPANAYSSNNVYATTANMTRNTTTNYLNCTGFNLNAPSGATITGITVYVERMGSKSNTFADAFVYLIKGGAISTALNGATATRYPTADAIETHGGQTSLWNTTWTAADVNATNFGVAFAAQNVSGSTKNRTASVDHIQIRVDYTLPTLHHFRIEHDGAASTCAPETVTVKACANAACTSYYTGGTISGIGLSPTTGQYTWTPSNPVSIPAANNGISSGITLARNNNGTAALAIIGTSSPAPSATYDCYNTATATSGTGGSAACNLVFSSNTFSFNVPDHTSATRQTATLTSCNGGFANQTRNVKFWSTYVNPASGTLPGKIVAGSGNADCATGYSTLSTAAGTPTTLSLAFGAGAAPQATFSLCYPDVGSVKLDAQYNGSVATGDNGVTILGNDSFIAKPDHFAVSNVKRTSDNVVNPAAADAAGGAFIAAGDATVAATQFTATVTAKNALNATTPNFGLETTPEGVALTVDTPIVAPTGGALGLLTCNGSTTGCTAPGGAANFSGGATTLTDLAWNEVGIMKILPKIGDGDYLGTGDITTPTASGNIGRFHPHHFEVAPDAATPVENRADICAGGVLVADGITPCTSPAYTYMDEEMNAQFTLTAMSASGTTTSNYTAANSFAKLDLTSSAALGLGAVNDPMGTPTYLSPRLDTALNPSGSFNVGVADIVAPIVFRRSATPDGPYAALNIGVAPVDSDGVAVDAALFGLGTTNVATSDHVLLGTTAVRFGRLSISDTSTNSSVLDLHVPMQTQYWNGASFVTTADDQETTLNAVNFSFRAGSETGYMHLSGASKNMDNTHISLTGFILNGAFMNGALDGLLITRPSPVIGGRGSAILEVDLGATGENKPYLLGKGTNYNLSPSATVTFGSNTNNYKSRFIDLRENY